MESSEITVVVEYAGSITFAARVPSAANGTADSVGVHPITAAPSELTDDDYPSADEQPDSNRLQKRSLELVEERPPEATYRPSSDREEARTVRALPDNLPVPPMPSMPTVPSMPSMPTVPSVPQMPSIPPVPQMPSMPSPPTIQPSDVLNRETPNDVVTVETSTINTDVETTTEDYGNTGDPVCNYDPFTYILKCGLNLITSIFGLSDTCCKSLI